jgi:uncharacterized protein DUF5947
VNALAALRDFARRPAVERCELCAAPVAPAHGHMLDRKTGDLRCACPTCERLLIAPGTPWTPVRRRLERLVDFRLSEEHWRAFGLPIDLAFFVTSRATGRVVARYPSAAGTVESGLPLPAWEAVVAANIVLRDLEADVEALVVNRAGGRRDYFVASIDECYRLVGLIRLHWTGLVGGSAVWAAIDAFFEAAAPAAPA